MAPATAEQLAAQQAQREPSMEEILASIRRIIEDSDTVRGANDVAPPPPAGAAAAHTPATPELEVFRAEFGGPARAAPMALEPSAPEVRSFSPTPAREPVAPPVREPVAPPAAERPAPAAFQPEAGDAEIDPLFDVAELSAAIAEPEAPAQAAPVAPAAPEAAAVPAQPRPSIVSEATGRQVAAAFGELSDAFAASRRRSFDEIAEEMMRPMLQEWLDNNLPTLVERLVREEIERVARGGA